MADFPVQPPVKGGMIPYIAVDGAVKAAEFYVKAFGAEIALLMPPDEQGRTMHVHLYVNGSSLMLGDFYPEHGHAVVAPQGYNLMILTQTLDQDYQQAVDAGCTGVMPPADMFWGDRYAQVKDPFGVTWAFNQGQR